MKCPKRRFFGHRKVFEPSYDDFQWAESTRLPKDMHKEINHETFLDFPFEVKVYEWTCALCGQVGHKYFVRKEDLDIYQYRKLKKDFNNEVQD